MKTIYCVGLAGSGKSTLFNKLLQQQYSLVVPCDTKLTKHNTYKSITHNYVSVYYNNYIIVDTPCFLNANAKDPYPNCLDKIFIYVINGILQPKEIIFLKKLKQQNRQIIGYYNNSIKQHVIEEIYYTYGYIFDALYHNEQTEDLLQYLSLNLDSPDKKTVALIGRVNSGKSYLFNSILKTNRSLVANYACTTRNYIEEPCRDFFLVDTPGYDLNKSDINHVIKNYRNKLMHKYHVIVLVINGGEKISRLDKQVFGQLNTLGCFCCVYINRQLEHLEENALFLKEMENKYPVFVNKNKLLQAITDTLAKIPIHISTPKLNKWIHGSSIRLLSSSGAQVKIKYMYQKLSNPIIIEYFSNHPMNIQSLKVIKQDFRKYFELPGIQVKFFWSS